MIEQQLGRCVAAGIRGDRRSLAPQKTFRGAQQRLELDNRPSAAGTIRRDPAPRAAGLWRFAGACGGARRRGTLMQLAH